MKLYIYASGNERIL